MSVSDHTKLVPQPPFQTALDVLQIPSVLSQDTWLDKTAITNWLEPFRLKSPHTHRAYQRAATYWLYFLEQRYGHHHDLLRRAYASDTHRFVQILTHEAPATAQTTDLLATPNHLGLKKNPFHTPKSHRSVTQMVAALSSLYQFNNSRRAANTPALLDFNPFAQVGRFLTPSQVRTDRVFEPKVYQHLLETIGWLSAQTDLPTEQLRLQRLRWITVVLFNLWLRVSELAQLKMGDFRQLDHDIWVLNVYGKGRKLRTVEVTPLVLQELIAYRTCLGLPPLPSTQDKYPAVWPLRLGNGMATTTVVDVQALTSKTLFNEIKHLATKSADFLSQDAMVGGQTSTLGLSLKAVEREALAQRLRQVSPHWFRHSGASEAINAQFSIADAAERLGHHDPAITVRMYYHGDMKRRFHMLTSIQNSR